MLFYCPGCRQQCDVPPVNTITTKANRVAYKANCPTCNQDMSAFNEEKGLGDKNQPITSNMGNRTDIPDNPTAANETGQPVSNLTGNGSQING